MSRMQVRKGSRPSPAMVLAVLALAFAMAGTAVAGTDGLTNKITKSKVKSIAKKQINKAAPGLSVAKAVNADHATAADTATNATNATNAGNASNLGGQPPSAFASSTSEARHVIGASGEPAFTNSWTNFGSGLRVAAFYKDSLGIVHLEGTIMGGANQTAAFTLPAGYRPSERLSMPMAAFAPGPAAGFLQVLTDGSVLPSCAGGCANGAGIDGLSFRP